MKYAAALLAVTLACAQSSDKFEFLGRNRGLGGLVATTVGPGPTAGSERFYASYLYLDHTIDVLGIDPATGNAQVFPNPAPGESGARGIVLGPDGNIYLGTLPKAHFLKLDTKAGKLIDLGRPSSTEEYIWDIAVGSDNRLYGVTYPQAKLVRCDPKTGKLEDLGRMDPVELYARTVATSTDGFVYIGIGTSKANVAAYEISTGQHREILPASAQVVGMTSMFRGEDGKVYGEIDKRVFRLDRWTATELPAGQSPARFVPNRLADGRTLKLDNRTLTITDPKTKATTERHVPYDGNVLPLFRVGFGPDGELYGSTILPIHLMKLDEAARRLADVGDIGGGEVYSFLNLDNRLLMAAYAGTASLMSFDPAKPFHIEGESTNPALVHFSGDDHGWRPEAMVSGNNGDVYLGSVAGYGKVDGPLTVWHVKQGTVEQFPIIEHQSVISLTMWRDRVIGGTTIHGGGGSHSLAKEARIFIWNPATRKVEFDMVAVPGTTHMTDVIAAPNDRVYGIAGARLFVFDPKERRVVSVKELPFRNPIYNSVAVGPDGRIWGLAQEGIFVIDPKTDEVSLVAKPPVTITAGFGMKDGWLYFVSDADVYRWKM